MLTGNVLRVEKTSIHDGDGLRTVLFLKGCPLRCLWCSTPESWVGEPEHGYGLKMTVDQAVREIAKDEVFYFHSGGGVTISGGEPLDQSEFVAEILKGCRERGINRALETSFLAPWERIEPLLPLLNLLFVDIKHIDPAEHRRVTGVGNEPILENIRRADSSPFDFDMILRAPIIPGVNDDDEHIAALGDFAASLRRPKMMEFLAYHRLGTDTYRKLGIEYPLSGIQVPSAEYMESKARIFMERCDLPVSINGHPLT